MAQFWLAALLFVLVRPQSVVFYPFASGNYRDDGYSNPNDESYFTGYWNYRDYRGYIAFDLTGLGGLQLHSAVVACRNPLFNASVPELSSLHVAEGDPSLILAGSLTGDPLIYVALAGTVATAVSPIPWVTDTVISYGLSFAGLSLINERVGSILVLAFGSPVGSRVSYYGGAVNHTTCNMTGVLESASPSVTASRSMSRSLSASTTQTPVSKSLTPSVSETSSPTATMSLSPVSLSLSPVSLSLSPVSLSPSESVSATASETRSPSVSRSVTKSVTTSRSVSRTPQSLSPSRSAAPSQSASPSTWQGCAGNAAFSWGVNLGGFRGSIGQLGISNFSVIISTEPLQMRWLDPPYFPTSGIVALSKSADSETPLAVAGNGDLFSWGSNGWWGGSYPQLVSLDYTVQHACTGDNFRCVVSEGAVYCWGQNGNGQLGSGGNSSGVPVLTDMTVAGGVPIVRVECGLAHAIALAADGQVFLWGDNSAGQIGNNATLDAQLPVAPCWTGNVPFPPGGFAQIATGSLHTLAITANTSVLLAWGRNTAGALGDGTAVSRRVPTAVLFGLMPQAGVLRVAAGEKHSIAVGGGGYLYAWGLNGDGQLGDSTTITRYAPVSIFVLQDRFLDVACGAFFSLALHETGAVYGWGLNDKGQLGTGDTTSRSIPTLVAGLASAKAIGAGPQASYAVVGWGCTRSPSTSKSLSKTPSTSRSQSLSSSVSRSPSLSPSLTESPTVSPSVSRSVGACPVAGQVMSWGTNQEGQLGNNNATRGYSTVPVDVEWVGTPFPPSGIVDVSSSALGLRQVAVAGDGSVYMWGRVDTFPQLISSSLGATQSSAGFDFACFLTVRSEVYCWGLNMYGQCGNGSTITVALPALVNVSVAAGGAAVNITKVSCGAFHVVALAADGQVIVWGQNSATGTLGNNDTANALLPTLPLWSGTVTLPPRGFSDVAAGYDHTLLIGFNRTIVVSFGGNSDGQLGDNTTITRRVPVYVLFSPMPPFGMHRVECGMRHSLALGVDTVVYSWGCNLVGELGDGTVISRRLPIVVRFASSYTSGFADIACGGYNSYALHGSGVVFAWGYNVHGEVGCGDTTMRTLPTPVTALPAAMGIGTTANNGYAIVIASCSTSPSVSPTPSVTSSNTETATTTPSSTQTPSVSASPSVSMTPFPSVSTSSTSSQTPTPSPSPSNTPSPSPSTSLSPSSSTSTTSLPSTTASRSFSNTQSVTFSTTPTSTPSASLTPSVSLSETASVSVSASGTQTGSPTSSPSSSETSSSSPTTSLSGTTSSTESPTTTASVTTTPSLTPSLTPGLAPSTTVTPTTSTTPSVTSSASPTPSQHCGRVPATLVQIRTNGTLSAEGCTVEYECPEDSVIGPIKGTIECLASGEWSAMPATHCVAKASCDGSGGFLTRGGACEACPEGAFCPGGSVAWPIAGYWSRNENDMPQKCRLSEACPGSAVAEAVVNGQRQIARCAVGYQGDYCSQCARLYYKSLDVCLACPNNARGVLAALGIGAAILFTIMTAGVVALPHTTLDIFVAVLVAFQQATLQARTAAARVASSSPGLASALSYLSVFSFDVQFSTAECDTGELTYMTLFLATLAMAAIIAVMFLLGSLIRAAVLVARERIKAKKAAAHPGKGVLPDEEDEEIVLMDVDEAAAEDVKKPAVRQPRSVKVSLWLHFTRRAVRSILILGTVVYLQLCTRAAQGVTCTADAQTRSQLLKTQLSIRCYEGPHLAVVWLVWIVLFVFCVGYPMLCAWKLLQHYRNGRLDHPEVLRMWGYLHGDLRTDFFWFQLLDFPATFIISVVAVAVDSPPARTLTSALVFVVHSVTLVAAWPYKKPAHNVLFLVLSLARVLIGVITLGADRASGFFIAGLIFAVLAVVAAMAILVRHLWRRRSSGWRCKRRETDVEKDYDHQDVNVDVVDKTLDAEGISTHACPTGLST